MVNPCALNPAYLCFKLTCGWICTIKGWVVLESLLLASEYFAAAWALRRVVFPILKGLFENFLSYQVLHGPVHDWIDQIKTIFYACMIYVGIGLCGALGAILEIGILLCVYAVYLVGTAVLNAKTLWTLLQSVLAAEEKFGKACNFVFAGKCNGYMEDLETYTYAGAVFLLACQLLTLICVVIQIRRVHKKTGAWLFTFCGKTFGRRKRRSSDDEENALEKHLPDGRRRRQCRPRAFAESKAVGPEAREKRLNSFAHAPHKRAMHLREDLPLATFDLPRRSLRP